MSVSRPQAVGSTAQAAGGAIKSRSLPRRVLPWLLRSLGLLVLLGLAFFGVDVISGVKLMLDARPEYLIPAFLVFCAALLMRMVVWIFLARVLNLGYRRLRSYVRIFMIGWSAGLGLPQGASPLARVAVLAADKRSVGRGVIVDVSDRLIQVATLLVLLVASTAYLSTESTLVLRGVGIGSAAVLGAVPLLLLATRLLRPLLQRVFSWRWLKTFTDDAAAALKELRSTRPSLLARIFALAMVAALLTVTSLFLTSRSLDVPLSYPALMAAFSAVSLTVLFPISINGLGPREGILAAAVAGAGFNSEAGVALGLLWFVMQAVTRLAAMASWFMRSAEREEDAALADEAEAPPG